MKTLLLSCCLVLFALPVVAQNSDAAKYAGYLVVVMNGDSTDSVMPMLHTVNGESQIEFVLASQIKESIEKGGTPIAWSHVTGALNEDAATIEKLKAENASLREENEKLWKVAAKDGPQQPTPAVVVQQQPTQTIPQQPSRLEQYMMLRSLTPPPATVQPYQVINPNANRLRTNCTTMHSGDTAYTNCN